MFVLVLKYIKNKIVILIIIKLPLTRFAGDKLGFSCAPLSSCSVLLFERLRKEWTQPCNRSCKSSLKCFDKNYSLSKYKRKRRKKSQKIKDDFQLIFG